MTFRSSSGRGLYAVNWMLSMPNDFSASNLTGSEKFIMHGKKLFTVFFNILII